MKQFSVKKFFIKHNKIIMTLVSVCLMFVFAMPTFRAPNQGERDKAPVGKLDGKKVTNDDMAFARGELSLLRELRFLEPAPSWVERFADDDSQASLYWYLICVEASRYASVTVTPELALTMAVDSMKQAEPGITAAKIEDKLDKRSINSKTLSHILSKLMTVLRYQNFLLGMPEPVAALELNADREFRRVQVQYVPVDAALGWDKTVEASADRLASQFEAYRNVIRTAVPTAPDDPPFFLGLETDENGEYALIGYPGAAEKGLHVHVKDTIPWDGSKIERIIRQGDYIGIGNNGLITSPNNMIVVSGGGRIAATPVPEGLDLHGRAMPELPPEIGGHRFSFGYKFPDRVKVEYLTFKFADLRKRMEATQADVQAAFKAFQANPYKFRPDPAATAPAAPVITVAPPTESQPASAPATAPATTQAASQPATRSAKEILSDWDDLKVREPYISEQVDMRCAKLLKNMLDAARGRAEVPWKGDITPPPAKWVEYRKLAAELGKDQAYLGYQPEAGTTGPDFFGANDLKVLPGIGRALFSDAQGQMFDFPTLATNIQELVAPEVAKRLAADTQKEPTADDVLREIRRQPLGRKNVPQGYEATEVTDKDGNLYLFRVTECQAAHVPASLDDKTVGDRKVRDDVAADCRKQAAYEQQVKALQTAVAGGDLEALATQFQSKVQWPKEFNRNPAKASVEVQYIRDLVKSAFTLPAPATGKPPSVTVVANDELRAYAVKVVKILPTSGADFRDERVFLYREADSAVVSFLQEYLRIEKMAARLNFTPAADKPFVKRAAAAP